MTDTHLLVLTAVDDEGATFDGAGDRMWIAAAKWIALGRPNSARYTRGETESEATFYHDPIDLSFPQPR